ncbi:MAG: hypothetical protein V7746_09315 [Halioglobus sp.]
MTPSLRRALFWGIGIAAYLRFGLEPTGWLFYEASNALDMAALYWGYTVFRGAGFALSLWSFQSLACTGFGVFIGLFIYWRASRSESI